MNIFDYLLTLTPFKVGQRSSFYRGVYINQKAIFKLSYNNDVHSTQTVDCTENEYNQLCKIRSSFVIKPLGFEKSDDNSQSVLILEDRGISLDSLGKLEFPLFIKIAQQLTIGLKAIHDKKIIHKNINPSNIVFDEESQTVCYIDFNLASGIPMLQDSISTGAIGYMSPEQTGRIKNSIVDYRTDFYSLGVTLYTLLTGVNPFEDSDFYTSIYHHLTLHPPLVNQLVSYAPKSLGRVLNKLMAKTPEERYQSAGGLRDDLQNVFYRFYDDNFETSFVPGKSDYSTNILISQKLIGREQERQRVLKSFNAVSNGTSEIVLIRGKAGIGKSSLALNVSTDIIRDHGIFISGKFLKSNHQIDYSAIKQALHSFVQNLSSHLLVTTDLVNQLSVSLGDNIVYLLHFIPALKERISNLHHKSIQSDFDETRQRLRQAVKTFIEFFAKPEHPVVLFLDDIQWIDSSSVKLIEYLIGDSALNHFMLICAYRDNETEWCPAMSEFIALTDKLNSNKNIVTLKPLSLSSIDNFVHTIIQPSASPPHEITSWLYNRSKGNPFHLKALINQLYHRHFLTFSNQKWQWNIESIKTFDAEDNVLSELTNVIDDFDPITIKVLYLIACCSSTFECCSQELLKQIIGVSEEHLELIITTLQDAQLINSFPNYFRCSHDKIYEATIHHMKDDVQNEMHLLIGRFLKASSDKNLINESAEHFINTAHLINNLAEREEIARLCLESAKAAKTTAAYSKSKRFLITGLKYIDGNNLSAHHSLLFLLHFELADSEYSLSDLDGAKQSTNLALQYAQNHYDQLKAYKLLICIYSMLSDYQKALEYGFQALALIGIIYPTDNFNAALMQELEEAKKLLGSRQPAQLIELDEMSDQSLSLAMDILADITVPLIVLGSPLYPITVTKIANLSMQNGIHLASAKGFVTYGVILGNVLHQYKLGYQFGLLGLRIADRFGVKSTQCRAYSTFSNWINHWTKPLLLACKTNDFALRAGLESNEFQYASYTKTFQLLNSYYLCNDFPQLLEAINNALVYFAKIKNYAALDTIQGLSIIVSTLISKYNTQLNIQSSNITDAQYLNHQNNRSRKYPLSIFLTLKAQLLYMFQDYEAAYDAIEEADVNHTVLKTLIGIFHSVEYVYYSTLVLIALSRTASETKKTQHLSRIAENLSKLREWSSNAPENYQHKLLLVEAELASLNNQNWEAVQYFNQAIKLSADNSFHVDCAIASERFALFWQRAHQTVSCEQNIQQAFRLYRSLGIVSKLDHLKSIFSDQLISQDCVIAKSASDPDKINRQSFDVEMITRTIQAFASQSSPNALLSKALNVILTDAGAKRGVLFEIKDNQTYLRAEYTVDALNVFQNFIWDPSQAMLVCPGIIDEVVSSVKPILVSNAMEHVNYKKTEYCRINKSRSILCLPIMLQGDLSAILYLENHEMAGVFSEEGVDLLILIATKLCIALQNIDRIDAMNKTLDKLEHSEKLFRVLSESAPVGIIHFNEFFGLEFLNQRYSEITGLTKERWAEQWPLVVHPDYRDYSEREFQAYMTSHKPFNNELKLQLPNGVMRWIVVNLSPIISDTAHVIGHMGVITDITQQKLLSAAIPRYVVDKIVQKSYLNTNLLAESTHNATILFADIVGFSQLTNKLMPTKLVEQLNAFYRFVDRLITAHGLTRLKYIGDCVMVIGGVVDNITDHFRRTVLLALELREKAFEIKLAGEPIRLRIGIHRGPIASGIIGDQSQMSFDVLGETVNISNRLQEHCSPDSIHILEYNAGLLENDFVLSDSRLVLLPSFGRVNTRKILAPVNITHRIIYSLLVAFHGHFPSYLAQEKTFPDMLKSLTLPNTYHQNVEDFFTNYQQPNLQFDSRLCNVSADKIYAIIQSINVEEDINQTLLEECSIIHLSILLDCAEVVRWSCYLEADFESEWNGFYPLMFACRYASLSLIRLLVSNKINKQNNFGWSALFVATLLNRQDVINLFLKYGVNINKSTKDGLTPLDIAAIYGYEDLVRLYASLSDIQIRNSDPFSLKINLDPMLAIYHAPQSLSAWKKRFIYWLLYRKKLSGSIPKPYIDFNDQGNIQSAKLRFIFANHDIPTLLLIVNDEIMMIDCGLTSLAALSTANITPDQIKHFVATNYLGSHNKGLELVAFYHYFIRNKSKPYLHINEKHINPLWQNSLSGGLCTLEGISPSMKTFFKLNLLADYDCISWQGLRIWLIPTSQKQNHKYCALMILINKRLIMINPDPIFLRQRKQKGSEINDEIESLYKRAEMIFANLGTYSYDYSKEHELLNIDLAIKQKTFAYVTSPNCRPLDSQYIRGIRNQQHFNLTEPVEHSRTPKMTYSETPSFFKKIKEAPIDHQIHDSNSAKLTFIGASTTFSTNNNNACLMVGGHKLLIDCGGTYFTAAKALRNFDPLLVEGVIITHLHLDHVGALADLAFSFRHPHEKKLKLYLSRDLVAPQPTKTLWENTLKAALSLGKSYKVSLSDYFDVKTLEDEEDFDWYGMTLQLIRMNHVMDHAQLVSTHGVMITIGAQHRETQGKKILYTSDTRNIPDIEKYCRPADLIFHDCSFDRNPVHTGINELLNLEPSLREKIWLMHTENMTVLPDISSFRGIVQSGQEFDLNDMMNFPCNRTSVDRNNNLFK